MPVYVSAIYASIYQRHICQYISAQHVAAYVSISGICGAAYVAAYKRMLVLRICWICWSSICSLLYCAYAGYAGRAYAGRAYALALCGICTTLVQFHGCICSVKVLQVSLARAREWHYKVLKQQYSSSKAAVSKAAVKQQ
jgi:hypothetical protein